MAAKFLTLRQGEELSSEAAHLGCLPTPMVPGSSAHSLDTHFLDTLDWKTRLAEQRCSYFPSGGRIISVR